MGVYRTGLLIVAIGLWSAPSTAQTAQMSRCLHGETESPVQQQRREDAVDSVDLITRILDRTPGDADYPSWETLAKSRWIASYRGMAGRAGDLARRIEWGSDQPLPGWRLHYVAAERVFALSLTDMRDPCQLTVATNDTGLIIEGRRADLRGQPRVVPLDSSQ
jgi:hypothetical protein